MKSSCSPKYLILQNDPELFAMLGELALSLEEKGERTVITRKESDKKSLPFSFFHAFARLTRLEEGIGALDLLSQTRKPPQWRIDLGWDEPVPYVGPSEDILRENPATTIDKDEAQVLKTVLEILDSPEEIDGFEPDHRIDYPDLVRQRIRDLVMSACWLEPENIRTGLLGSVNGTLQYNYVYFQSSFDVRGVSPPTEFSCPFIDSMLPLEKGLFFNQGDLMPPSVAQAVKSVVRFKFVGSWRRLFSGSGVVVEPRYMLSCEHILEESMHLITTRDDGSRWIETQLMIGDKKYDAKLQIIDVPGNPDHKKPDLKIFYWPEMPAELLSIAVDAEVPEKSQVAEPHFVLGWQDFELEEPVSVVTDPENRETKVTTGVEDKVVVSAGILDREAYGNSILTRSTAIALPGFSGGPVVNQAGELIGLVVVLAESDSQTSYDLVGQSVTRARVTGSKFYSMDSWWKDHILRAIENHKDSLEF